MTTESQAPVQDTHAPPEPTQPLPPPPRMPSLRPNTVLGVAKIVGDVIISLGIFALIYAGKIQAEIGLVFICALLGLSVAHLLRGFTSGPTSGASALVIAGLSTLLHRISDVTKLSMVTLMLVIPTEHMLSACSATPRQVVHASVVTAGSITAQLIQLNNDAYQQTIRAQNPDNIEPMEQEYLRRAHALAAVSTALYAAASINDMVGVSPEQRSIAARHALTALEDGVEILTDGALLPALQLTPEQRSTITSVIRLLSVIIQTQQHSTPMDASAQ